MIVALRKRDAECALGQNKMKTSPLAQTYFSGPARVIKVS